jgi:hypothetical protein
MRKKSRTERVLLVAGVAVATLGLAAQAAADEPEGVSARTTHQIERPAVVLDPESPAEDAQTVGPPEARTESSTLPSPADRYEPPPPPDSTFETVIGEAVVIRLAPRHLRRPRLHP